MDSLINLQELNVEHFDVTFINFVFTANRYKVIDFDSAKLYYSKK
jgi:thiamine kinase-like enzyme